ncbi:MAG TPA: TIGR03668 family PPOX class F420-dependent oxidoreductase [Candidatus Dormibacteraeota bacterium]|nr:TIGR03668 family PPOX class F420-dependent oxidoreductase [Candidatus Dormibacteraeota bacterium]
MRRLVDRARVARLATSGPDAAPHIVPVCFALDGDTVYFVVDAKPKRTRDLKRLRNIAANPRVSLLVDHYEDDWGKLWWVRMDGRARVLADGAESESAIKLLAMRYAPYRTSRPAGPVVAVAIDRWTDWSGS